MSWQKPWLTSVRENIKLNCALHNSNNIVLDLAGTELIISNYLLAPPMVQCVGFVNYNSVDNTPTIAEQCLHNIKAVSVSHLAPSEYRTVSVLLAGVHEKQGEDTAGTDDLN